MLSVTKTAAEKRRDLRDKLASGRLIRTPGAFSPLVARLLEEQGWEAVYISGAVLSADLGLPDIGLTTLSEVSQRGYQIARATNLPCVIDVDTGFGEPMNAYRTMREMEELGLSSFHLEDQEFPKRCGHLDNKEVVPVDVMVRRIKAAVEARQDDNFLIMARTDARSMEGLDAAIDRARAYVDAGADAIFPEAMKDQADFEAFRKAIDVPLLANMTEFGKSDLLTVEQMQNLGLNLVIYPVTSLRVAMGAVEDAFAQIRKDGTQENVVPRMQTRARLYELLSYEDYNKFDTSIFNFKV